MYGLSKNIRKYFGFITKPGFGAIQPALKRLEKQNFLKSGTFFTDGGKACCYYSITDEGIRLLVRKIKEKPSRNPVRFLPLVKIKLLCSDILEQEERSEFYKMIGNYITSLCTEAEKSLDIDNDFCRKNIVSGTIDEYKRLIELTGRLEHAGNGSFG